MIYRDDKARVRRCLSDAQDYLDRGKRLAERDVVSLCHRLFVLSETFHHLEMAERAIDWLEKMEA